MRVENAIFSPVSILIQIDFVIVINKKEPSSRFEWLFYKKFMATPRFFLVHYLQITKFGLVSGGGIYGCRLACLTHQNHHPIFK